MAGKPKVPYEKLVEAFLEAKSGTDAAARFGVSEQTVYAALNRHGLRAIDFQHRATDQEIIEAYQRIGSGTEVAKLLHADSHHVYDVLKSHGIDANLERKKRLRVIPEDQEERVMRDYEAGQSMAEIAGRFGCSANAILELLRRRGVRTRKRKLDLPKDEIKRLYEGGMNYTEIAAKYRCSYTVIINLINKEFPELVRPKTGPDGPRWRGGHTIHHGYRYIWLDGSDPLAAMATMRVGKNRGTHYGLEHRIVMARHLGRCLLPGENVHHKNGDKLDNRLENLELWTEHQPKGQRVSDTTQHALALLEARPDLTPELREALAKYKGGE